MRVYEPDLLATVCAILEHSSLHRSPYPRDSSSNGPLHCCALFGWAALAEELLSRSLSESASRGEHGLLPGAIARAQGWMQLAEKLEQAMLNSGRDLRQPEVQSGLAADGSNVIDHQLENRAKLWRHCAKSNAPGISSTAWIFDEWERASLPRCNVKAPRSGKPVDEASSHTLSEAAFMQRAFLAKKPLVLRGGAIPAPSPREVASTLDSVSSNGELCSIPYPHDFMPRTVAKHATWPGGAQDVFAGGRGYLFSEVDQGSAMASLLARNMPIASLLPFVFRGSDPYVLQQLSLGQSGTGAPWHWHQDAFNICLVGERAWYMKPPAEAIMSRQPVCEGIPSADGSYFTMQGPGDIIYVPEMWSHCVINCKLSFSVAVEFGNL